MKRFITPPYDRHQAVLFRETLDATLSSDHPVRVVDELLDQVEWSDWESRYGGGGRPAYPPEYMVKLLIYGYSMGIRSSRQLEHSCRNGIDFIWLMEGLSPDHDTIAAFRRENGNRIKELFRMIVAAGAEAGLVSMKRIAVDGTKVEANSSKWATGCASEIEKKLSGIDAAIERMFDEAEREDRSEDALFGDGVSPNELPPELRDLKRRRESLRRALEKVKAKGRRAMEKGEAGEEEASRKRVPLADPDADVMKNKRGGFAPNFNAYLGVDCDSQLIVSGGVTNEHVDAGHLKAACEDAEDASGLKLGQAVADSAYATTENLEYLEGMDIDPCIAEAKTNPCRARENDTPAWPDDVPSTASHVEGWEVDGTKLERNRKGMLTKSAFTWDARFGCYICPTGHKLESTGNMSRNRMRKALRMRFRCRACGACPFRPVCTTNSKGRTVNRNSDADVHERHQVRMREEQRRAAYKLRRSSVEPVFGLMKEVLRMRRFHLRGLPGVNIEWMLAALAFNLRRLISLLKPGLQTSADLQTFKDALKRISRKSGFANDAVV